MSPGDCLNQPSQSVLLFFSSGIIKKHIALPEGGSTMCRLIGCWILACIVASMVATRCPAQTQFPSNLPQMSGGTVTDPVSAISGSYFYYAITHLDKDTLLLGIQVRDDTCRILPDRIDSMQPNTLSYGISRVGADGTITWGISGKALAVTTEVRRLDVGKLYNDRPASDVFRDDTIYVVQTVIIRPPSTQPPSTQPPGGGS